MKPEMSPEAAKVAIHDFRQQVADIEGHLRDAGTLPVDRVNECLEQGLPGFMEAIGVLAEAQGIQLGGTPEQKWWQNFRQEVEAKQGPVLPHTTDTIRRVSTFGSRIRGGIAV